MVRCLEEEADNRVGSECYQLLASGEHSAAAAASQRWMARHRRRSRSTGGTISHGLDLQQRLGAGVRQLASPVAAAAQVLAAVAVRADWRSCTAAG